MKSHCNIPIFIPHMGCPHQCVFCNQRSISGHESFSLENVRAEIETALATVGKEQAAEIAFFGGSFTGIDRDLMIKLLAIAESYVSDGRVQAIRLSTRPDYVNDEILSVLSRYSVRTIELGLQSMNDRVLRASRRGHTSAESVAACRAVVAAGFSLVGQMMVGLPASTPEDEWETARAICSLGASAARIYPTVVFYDTPLCRMAQEGSYVPLSDGEAAQRSAEALRVFLQHGVPCIRIGLCASEQLTSSEKVFAGANHPAMGEMVWNEYYYGQLLRAVHDGGLADKPLVLHIPMGDTSKVLGQHRCNALRVERKTGARILRCREDASLPHGTLLACCASENI